MGIIHVECLPDETLVKKLGITRKMVHHHAGKSRVFNKLKTTSGDTAMVDEDPGSIKTDYENQLTFIQESFGIKLYKDKRGNKILILKIKLEDWIIAACKVAKVNISDFGLSDRPNDLHEMINQRLSSFEKLIDYLKETNNQNINHLINLLN
jgi:hypothetical protein